MCRAEHTKRAKTIPCDEKVLIRIMVLEFIVQVILSYTHNSQSSLHRFIHPSRYLHIHPFTIPFLGTDLSFHQSALLSYYRKITSLHPARVSSFQLPVYSFHTLSLVTLSLLTYLQFFSPYIPPYFHLTLYLSTHPTIYLFISLLIFLSIHSCPFRYYISYLPNLYIHPSLGYTHTPDKLHPSFYINRLFQFVHLSIDRLTPSALARGYRRPHHPQPLQVSHREP
jgi:hypothetical protein